MLPPRNPSQIRIYTQTKSKGMEKDISCKWKGKKAGVAVLISDKINFKSKAIVRDKKMTLHNDVGNNPKKGYNPSKHVCSQHCSI